MPRWTWTTILLFPLRWQVHITMPSFLSVKMGSLELLARAGLEPQSSWFPPSWVAGIIGVSHCTCFTNLLFICQILSPSQSFPWPLDPPWLLHPLSCPMTLSAPSPGTACLLPRVSDLFHCLFNSYKDFSLLKSRSLSCIAPPPLIP
jgi:hypothetical protein